MRTVRPLHLTLLSSLRPRAAGDLARAFTGASVDVADSVAEIGSDLPDESPVADIPADSAAFAADLIDDLLSQVDHGLSGDIVVHLPSRADPLEVGLVVGAVCDAREPDEAPVLVRDIVTVVSLLDVRAWLFAERDEDPARPDYDTAERLAAQIEYATLLVVTDTGGVSPSLLNETLGLLRRLNVVARIVPVERATQARRPAAAVVPGAAALLAQNLGWQRELSDGNLLGRASTGIDAVVFREPLPFHPGRLAEAVAAEFGQQPRSILRSRGLARLASRPFAVGSWASAGDVFSLDPTSIDSWDSDVPLGQELVFYGRDLDAAALTDELGRCLLTPDELLGGPMLWARFDDPLPAWELPHRH
ncbi:GTP-binding protein [Frondihabitans sp. Leaf304]|uniref:GTP-binding protein n=1 Tax=Frondihabitans sp. Leaf304 TaxID=1736329 RepID=UPI0006FCC2D5|nr:GTP-binding protein [Frondihabitans sp. Leaf304]KQQ27874.1 hypothetical protein ASF54_03770 [Frondihabitans sp. Leaf304]